MTREEMISRICELEENASDELFGTPEPIRNAFRAGVEQGYDAKAKEIAAVLDAVYARLMSDHVQENRWRLGVLGKTDLDRAVEDIASIRERLQGDKEK